MKNINNNYIISTFPGVGKTFFKNKYKKIKIKQLYSKDLFQGFKQGIIKDTDWYFQYINEIKYQLRNEINTIFLIPSDYFLLDFMNIQQLKYILIYPDYKLKQQYVKRFQKVEKTLDFKIYNRNHWHQLIYFLQILKKQQKNQKIKIISQNVFLTDILLVNDKNEIEIKESNYVEIY